MSYWFAFRVYQKGVDLEPCSPVLEGPFETYLDAKKEKMSIRGGDIQKTSIFPAESKEEAENQLARET